MNAKENLEILAKNIWKSGELKKGEGCLMSSDFHFGYNDDPIIDEYHVTHYDRQWEEQGKSVRINLYEGDAFGAAEIKSPPKESFVINV
jgi:hypothetical protein